MTNISMQFVLLTLSAIAAGPSLVNAVDSEDWLWLSCGSGQQYAWCQNGAMDIQAQAKDKHQLRCCSDTAIAGWGKGRGCDNWHESDLVGLDGKTKCFHDVTYAEAQAICTANHNSYVCTKEQVDNRCAQGSGCHHDLDYVWTSSPAPPMEMPTIVTRNPDDWLYLACGRGKDGCDAKFDLKAQAKEKHDLRCCSRKERVDWLHNGGDCKVWHESDMLKSLDGQMKCFHEVTYEEAQAICEANDAYVCTKEEVDAGCVQGSGCYHDLDYIWTSTAAPSGLTELPGQEEIGEDEYMFLACGSGWPSSQCSEAVTVAKASEQHEVRCCSHTPKESQGWIINPGCKNWHETDLINPVNGNTQCFHASTYAEAQEICTANGAYVCTREQVLNGCARGSGCYHDLDQVWTSNKATPEAVAAFRARQTQAAEIKGVCSEANGKVWGDPHFVTFDNLKYDCQGQGEFVIAMSKGSDPLAIHGRFVKRFSHKAKPTVTGSLAIKVLEDVPTIHVTVPDERVNGACPFTFTMGDTESPVENNDVVTFFQNNYNGTVKAFSNGKSIIFTFAEQKARVQVTAGGRGRCVLNTNLCLTPEKHGGPDNIVGLLGSPTGNKDDDWVNRDGSITALPDVCDVANPSKAQQRACKHALNKNGHEYCMENWCIGHADNSLWKPETHALYNQCDDTDPDPFFDNPEEPDPAVVAACANTENPEECETDTVAEIEDGGDLEEFVETLVEDEEEANIVENLGENNADESLEGWNGPVLDETSSIQIDLPEDFDELPPEDFGGGEAPVFEDIEVPPEDPPEDLEDPPEVEVTPNATPEVAENAGSLGDPHFETWQGEHFEFHGQCDMILTRDLNFADGLGLDVQIRTKLVRFWSYIKRAAIRIGDDILEVQGSMDPEPGPREAQYWYNLEYKGLAKTADKTIGGFPLKISHSGVSKSFFEIDLDSKYPGQKIVLSTFREFVRVDFRHASAEVFGNTVGMLGDFKTGNLLARDGVTEIDDFVHLGNEWQVLPADYMLFHDTSEPQFPKRCIVPEDPQGLRRRRLGESKISLEEAEAACSKTLSDPLFIKDCVYDILATQDLDMVGAF